MILRYAGATVVLGAIALETVDPGCSTDDRICTTLAMPVHTHSEIPAGTGRINVTGGFSISGSNVAAHSMNFGGREFTWK